MAIRPRTTAFIAIVGVIVLGIAGTVVYNLAKSTPSAPAASGKSAAASGTVTWWVPDWDYPEGQKLVSSFEKQNPNITVKMVQTTGATIANQVSVALNSGNVPDVITDSISRVQTYVSKGQVANLGSIYDSSMPKSDFAPGVVDAVSKGGKTYAVPYRWATNALIYNPKLFAAAGIKSPPKTWAEFEADAKKLTTGDVVGTAWPMSGDPNDLVLRLLDFAVSDGSTIKNGAPSLTKSSVKNALDLIGGSVKDGWASSSSYQLNNTDIYNLFAQGRVAMYPGGVFDTDTATAAKAPIATAPLPGPKGIGTAQGVGWAYIVPAKSSNKPAAEKLVAFLGKPANMAALTLTFPARVSATKAARFQTDLRKPFVEQLSSHSIPAPTDPRWTVTIQAIHDDIEQVALGQSSSSLEAATIVQQANTSLGK